MADQEAPFVAPDHRQFPRPHEWTNEYRHLSPEELAWLTFRSGEAMLDVQQSPPGDGSLVEMCDQMFFMGYMLRDYLASSEATIAEPKRNS